MRKPFYKSNRQTWYCELDRKQHKLAQGDKEATRELAEREWHRLVDGQAPVTNRTTVEALVDQFLSETKLVVAESTYDWYLFHCQRFVNHIGHKLTVSDLKPIHVTRWISKMAGANSYKNGAVRAVCRAFNWARKQGLLKINPLDGMERPAHEPREIWLTPEQWEKLVNAVEADDPFADFIWFLHETGCRPQEARFIAACHWDRGDKITLPRKESKGKKRNRVIYLSERAQEIVSRLALKHPTGALLRNTRGNAWTKDKIIQRFTGLRKKLKFPVIAYTLRHTWITNALKRGVDVATVARLAGHTDSTMVLRVYGHHVKDDAFLATKLRQANAS